MNFIRHAGTVLALIAAASVYAQRMAPARKLPGSVTWRLDSLENIGEPVTTLGKPQIIHTPHGKAISFDGLDDGIVINVNPLSGARAFTVEAVFRPDAGGSEQQRWLHIQEDTSDNRVLLEIRLSGDEWFLDTYIKSGENSRALYAESFKHRVGEWYHVALVYDGATMRHYVDGHEELSGPLAIKPVVGGRTSIGVRLNRVFWFKGAVSKARFTRRALLPKEFMSKQ